MDDDIWDMLGGMANTTLADNSSHIAGGEPEDNARNLITCSSPSNSTSSSSTSRSSKHFFPKEKKRLSSTSSRSSSSTMPADKENDDQPAKFTKVFDKQAVSADLFSLPAQHDVTGTLNMEMRSKVTCEKIEGTEAWIFDHVFSEEECALLRAQAETAGFAYWDPEAPREGNGDGNGDGDDGYTASNPKPGSGKNGSRDDFRTAFTVEVRVPELANVLWERLGPFMEPITITPDCPKHEVDIEGDWHPCAMNPHWLFSRYIDGGHFSPHTDGNTVYDFNTRTIYTLLVYLSSSEDGQTRIFDDKQMSEPFQRDGDGKLRGNEEHVIASVAPRVGRVLCFYHRLMHEGNPAKEKYIIRTDCVFERRPAQCTAEEDKEAFRLYLEAQQKSEEGLCEEAMVLFRRAFKMSPALCKVYGM